MKVTRICSTLLPSSAHAWFMLWVVWTAHLGRVPGTYARTKVLQALIVFLLSLRPTQRAR